ncbi:MAG: hypothetical protein CVV22_11535 [Ignavibacteriae bacterium HGW-Ignavibacteriae-1]|jgi:5-methylcytosine-specific restriction protein B|nr:MAG: hypothetical protein CVV22_11535 [Ignavibacteriae bacterium HGW-Ignavibacteriae-1]
MNKRFQYITDLAKQYSNYAENQDDLYDALNKLPKNVVEEIYQEYGNLKRDFKPVNLLRAEIARRILQAEKVSEILVNEIKERIRAKDVDYFDTYSEKLKNGLKNYKALIGNSDYFTAWNNYWRVLYVFFFRGKVKVTVSSYLQNIGEDLKEKLKLYDYNLHTVNFNGTANFGSTYCWLALYPKYKISHKDSYQFFVQLDADSVAGQYAGSSVNNSEPNELKPVNSYEDILELFEEMGDKIIQLNLKNSDNTESTSNADTTNRKYFKFAPGSQASEWDKFYNEGVVAIRFANLNVGDISSCNSNADVNLKAGLAADNKSNQTWNAWLLKSANIGDVVFANKGVNTCIGIGIIEGDYYYEENVDGYNHRRKVKWITDKVYKYTSKTHKGSKGGTYITLFRPDTFSPTAVYEFILNEYIRLYPELAEVFAENYLMFETNGSKISESKNHKQGPKFLRFFNPLLKVLNKVGEGKPSDITKLVIDEFNFTSKELEQKSKTGVPIIYNQVAWARNYLKDGGLISNDKRGIWSLTEYGKNKTLTDKEAYELFKFVQLRFRKQEDELAANEDVQQEIEIDVQKYSFSEDSDKPFISEQNFLQTVALLRKKKNIILQGPPGVGKTFIARKLAYEMMQEVKDANIEMVQFHQSYSYEDFIQGLRPTQNGGFDLKDGIFYLFCQRALAHPDRPFFFIIDEINRGNLSKIFGELMMLIEADKREEKFALKLTYAEDEEDRFYVPQNIYIIGTMNTADRSLAIVDYALRRRFAFVTLQPDYGDNFRTFLSENELTDGMIEHICSSVTKVNTKIKDDINLGEGFQIGHSYFCTFNNGEDENQWWDEILNFELKPLLEEIWFDETATVETQLEILKRKI